MTGRAGDPGTFRPHAPVIPPGLVSGRDGLAFRATFIERRGARCCVLLSRHGRPVVDEAGEHRRVWLYDVPDVVRRGRLPEAPGETEDVWLARVTVAAWRLL